MTLEAAIQENTAVLKQLITVMQSAGVMTASVSAGFGDKPTADTPAVDTTTKVSKKTKAADTVKEEPKTTEDLVAGDASGTRYFVVAKHKTVGTIKPGEDFPAIEGLEPVGGAKYLEWKDTYAKMPAKTEDTKVVVADDKTFEVMNTAFQKLVNDNSKGQGEGRKAGLAILAKFGVKNVQGAFALGKFDEIMGDVDAALAPAAAFDPFA